MTEYMTNLVQIRKERKVTQTQLAEKLGISQQQWSDYERGKYELPIRYLIQVCKILEVSSSQILGI